MNSENLINIDKSILPANMRVAIVDGKAFPIGVNKTGNEGVIEYYRCASVDTSSGTWSGFKAVLADGVYSFEETLTEGLTYTTMVPVVDSVYSGDGGLRVGNIYVGSTEPPEDEEPEDDDVVTVFRLDDYRYTSSMETNEASGYLETPQGVTTITSEDLPQFASDEVSAFRITSADNSQTGLMTVAKNDKLPDSGQAFMITASVYIDNSNIDNSGYRHILGFGNPTAGDAADTINLLINVEKEGRISVAADYGTGRLTYTFPSYTRAGLWITLAVMYNGEGSLTLYATDGVLTENIEDFKVAEASVTINVSGVDSNSIRLSYSSGDMYGYTGPGTGYSIVTLKQPTTADATYQSFSRAWTLHYSARLAYAVIPCAGALCDNLLTLGDGVDSPHEVADKCDGCSKLYCPEHREIQDYRVTCRQCGGSYCMDCFTSDKCPAGPSTAHEV